MDDAPSPCPKCGGPRDWYVGKRQRHSRCKPCLAAKALRHYHANRERQIARMRAWREANPEKMAACQRAWGDKNRERRRDLNREYYRQNRDGEIARSLAYTKANPHVDAAIKSRRRARKLDGICEHGDRCVTAAFLKAVRSSACTYCGLAGGEADHYRPLARGGLHCVENIVPACKPCNGSKHANDPDEWRKRRSSA